MNFYTNMSKDFTLTTTSVNMIYGNDNEDNIHKLFTRVLKEMEFVPRKVNNVKYKFLM